MTDQLKVLQQFGIKNFGGEPNGVSLEIEYRDSNDNHIEAIYKVPYMSSFEKVSHSRISDEGRLSFYLGNKHIEITLENKCKELISIRKPECAGGEDFSHLFCNS